tara:strand:- start:1212 stop:2249 length:1038 start_codon:yes stop_codon:yes gene_type:complete
MLKTINRLFYILLFLVFSCGGGGGSSPTETEPDTNDSGDNLYDFPNATNLDQPNQIEVVTWNIRNFPQHSTSADYVKALLEKWNADIYLFQEVSGSNDKKSELIEMLNSMTNYSYVLDEESGNLGFALVYKTGNVTFISKNELWSDTPNGNDGDSDYENNAQYQFASRPPMESYITWTDGTKSMDLYVINVHYKCCGDDEYESNDPGDETTRRHHASLLLTDYIINNRSSDNVIIAGDFNNVGEQSVTNPTISPFTDPNIASSTNFSMVDKSIMTGPSSGYSWQGWTSSYAPAHFDHIIINTPLLQYESVSTMGVIHTPTETNSTPNVVDSRISDHQPVFFRFLP